MPVAVGLLLFAMFGDPPESYFEFMKFAVLIASGYVAVAFYTKCEQFSLVSLYLLALGVFEAFGELYREQWRLWYWAMIGAFSISVCVLMWRSRKMSPTTQAGSVEAPALVSIGYEPSSIEQKETAGAEVQESELPQHDITVRDQHGRHLTRVTRTASKRHSRSDLAGWESRWIAGRYGSDLVGLTAVNDRETLTQ